MESSSFSLGESGSDQLFSRRLDPEPPEFDITAMVDLVFMMNIYFLVTFITSAMTNARTAAFLSRNSSMTAHALISRISRLPR